VRRIALLLVLLPALLLPAGCSTLAYLGRQGVDQLRLLRARRRVSDVLTDPATPPMLRERLRLVMEARRFGVTVLGLRGGAEFTRYVESGEAVAYNLTAAYRTRLKPLTWRFPLVGRVPYLGFFRKEVAEAEARRLQAEGYDTYVRPVGAYSTLGYLLSPIYSSMIDQPGARGELRAVETILHEMAHTTAWLNSASDLNESYATLVGQKGAAAFFRWKVGQGASAGGVDTSAALAALQASQRDAEQDEQRATRFAGWLRGAMKELDALYGQAARERWPEAEVLRRREEVFAGISARYREAFPGARGLLAKGPPGLNNAVLLSFGVYHLGRDGDEEKRRARRRAGIQLQRDLYEMVGEDLGAYIALYKRAAERQDGAAWLRRLAAEAKP
jgi:predicted aminopeptidase